MFISRPEIPPPVINKLQCNIGVIADTFTYELQRAAGNGFTQESPGNCVITLALPRTVHVLFVVCICHTSTDQYRTGFQLTFYDLLLTHGPEWRNKIFNMFYACLHCAARHGVFTKPTEVGISISYVYNTTN